jgi:hypothetical protein
MPPLDQDDDADNALDAALEGDDIEGAPTPIIGDDGDDDAAGEYHGGPPTLELARHRGGTLHHSDEAPVILDEDTFGVGDALRSDKAGITG